MPTNFYMFFLTALIPLVVGAVYYHPSVIGNAWMKSNGFTTKDLEGGNMPVIFGTSFIMGVLISFTMSGIAIHQMGIVQTVFGAMETNPDAINDASAFLAKYGDVHRTFGHGALHGAFFTLFFVFPLITINALFERRGWKYIFIHTGYWLISLTLIAAILCQTLEWGPLQ